MQRQCQGPISVSVQKRRTRQPLFFHGGPLINLNPPNSTKRTLSGCCRHGHRDKDGEDGRNIRIQFFIGAAMRMLHRGCAHFAFHSTISPSNTVLSVKSDSYVLKNLSVVSGMSRWIFVDFCVVLFQQPFVEFFRQMIDQR